MKISTFLIYVTFLLHVNTSFSHERKDLALLQKFATENFISLIVHREPKKINKFDLISDNNITEDIILGNQKVTLINFWATWCVPCREEMPSLNNLVKNVKSKDFSIIVVAAGRNSDREIKKFFLAHNLDSLKSYKDPKGRVSSKLNVFGLPTTIIVDQHSNELARLTGSMNWDSKEMINFINEIIQH